MILAAEVCLQGVTHKQLFIKIHLRYLPLPKTQSRNHLLCYPSPFEDHLTFDPNSFYHFLEKLLWDLKRLIVTTHNVFILFF